MADRNEGKALDAVLRFIEARDHAPRENDGWSPDDPKDPDPDRLRRVDYVCTVGRVLYAFEHTRIEPFIDQIELEVQNRNLFGPIMERFDHRSDREFWELIVPVDASAGLAVNDVRPVQDALIKWIETNASLVPVAPLYDRRANPPLGESADGVPFRFSLHRASLEGPYYPSDSLFRWMSVAPANLEQQRAARLKTASERKSPKLAKWKRDSAAWLTNHFRVADALAPAEATTPEAPDEVFMVSTGLDQAWWVVCLRGPGLIAGDAMPHSEFDPKELKKLTSR